MRIKKLTMQSFGSYEEETVIDFDKISGRGIFLVSGDTGSGKSTIFDAIFYALYEELSAKGSGPEGNDKFVSQYRTDMTKDVFVELEFTDKNGDSEDTYIIRRNPKYIRKKLRSDGVTEQDSKCTLTLMDKTLTKAEKQYTKKDEIRNKINELIGLNKEEFRQVGMIAQGEFMEFLRSTTGQKKEVFRKLFNTGIYEKIESSLKDKCNAKKADMEKFTDICKNDISRIDLANDYEEGTEGYNLYSELNESVNDITDKTSAGEISISAIENLLEIFGQVCEDISEQKIKVSEEFDKAQAELDIRKKNYDLGTELEARFKELETAEAEYIEQSERKPEIDSKKILIAQTENAYKIQSAHKSFSEADGRYKETLDNKSRCEEIIPQLKAQTEPAKKDEAEKEKIYNELNEKYLNIKAKAEAEIKSFGDLKDLKKSLADDEKKLTKITVDIKKKKSDKESYETSLENDKKRFDELKDICAAGSDINNSKKNITGLLADLENTKETFGNLTDNCDKHDRKMAEYRDARSEYKKNNDIYQQSYLLFLDSQSGIIARDRLKAGEPCPVCGSLEHPAPCALSEDKTITREELEKLEKDFKDSIDTMTRCSSECGISQRDIFNGYENIKNAISRIFENMSTGGEYEETVEYYEGEKELRSAFEDVFGGEFRGKIDKELGNKSAMENCGEAGDESGENAIGENHNESGKSNNEPNSNNIENSLNDIESLLAGLNQFLDKYKSFLENKSDELDALSGESEEISKKLENAETDLNDMAAAIEESEKDRQAVEIEIAKNKDAVERITASFTFKSIEEAEVAESDAKFQKEAASERFNEAKALKESLEKKINANETLLKSYAEQLPKLKEDSEKCKADYEAKRESSRISEDNWKKLVSTYTEDIIKTYKEEVHNYEINLSSISGKIEMAKKSIGESRRPDMEHLSILKEETQNKRDKINENYIAITNRESSNKGIYDNISKQLSERQKTAEGYKKTERLYNKITGGESGNRIRLETFVQRYYLKQILVRANNRFRDMTDGQYELRVIDEEKAGTGGRNGSDNSLSLYVYSYENDSVRSIETLSGGEIFMASLALALGITDRIEERSSAVNLDIMFIDEGFGSLDDNARRESVKMLQRMSGGKKQVGIISHVTELKQEIPTQLKVYKDENGSHAEWQIN